MENKKFDLNSLIGFILIGAIFIWMLYLQKPTEEEIAAEEAKIEAAKLAEENIEKNTNQEIKLADATSLKEVSPTDSLGLLKLQNQLGSFSHSRTLPSANGGETVVENACPADCSRKPGEEETVK